MEKLEQTLNDLGIDIKDLEELSQIGDMKRFIYVDFYKDLEINYDVGGSRYITIWDNNQDRYIFEDYL